MNFILNEHNVYVNPKKYEVVNEKRIRIEIDTASDGEYWYGSYHVDAPDFGCGSLPSSTKYDPIFKKEDTVKLFYLRKAKNYFLDNIDNFRPDYKKRFSVIINKIKNFKFIDNSPKQLSLLGY